MIDPQIRYVVTRLKMVREILGLTLDHLGLGGSKSLWSNFENLRSEPRLSTIIKYADSVGVPLDALFSGCPNSAGESSVNRDDTITEAKRLYGSKLAVGMVEQDYLWLCVCLGGVSDEWKATCQDWIKKEVKRSQSFHSQKIREHQAEVIRKLGRHGIPAGEWYCVTVGPDVYIFDNKEEANTFALKGKREAKEVAGDSVSRFEWMYLLPDEIKNIITRRGSLSREKLEDMLPFAISTNTSEEALAAYTERKLQRKKNMNG